MKGPCLGREICHDFEGTATVSDMKKFLMEEHHACDASQSLVLIWDKNPEPERLNNNDQIVSSLGANISITVHSVKKRDNSDPARAAEDNHGTFFAHKRRFAGRFIIIVSIMGNLCANGEGNGTNDEASTNLTATLPADEFGAATRSNMVSIIGETSQQEVKILCLGSGESGKSTFNRQMRFLYSNHSNTSKASEDDKRKIKQQIHNDMIKGMRALVLLARNPTCSERTGLQLDPSSIESADTLDAGQPKKSGNFDLTAELGNCIQQLWKDAAIRACWNDRVELWPLLGAANSVHKELYDSLEAYFDSTPRIQEDT